MNELETVRTVRRALEARAQHLPYRVTHRLERARATALGRMPATATQTVPRLSLAGAGASADTPWGENKPSLAWRMATMLAPIVVLAAGLMLVSAWNDVRRAEDVADIDTALLLDDVPLSVYADKGFGVYLKNTQQ